MRVLLAGPYPAAPAPPTGGPEALIWELARGLAGLSDVEVHVAAESPGTATQPGVTVHRPAVRSGRLVPAVAAQARFVRQVAGEVGADLVHALGLGGESLGAVTSGLPHLVMPPQAPRTRVRRPGMTPLSPQWIRELWQTGVGNWSLKHAEHVAVLCPRVRSAVETLVSGRMHVIAFPVAPEFYDLVHQRRPGDAPVVLVADAFESDRRPELAVRALAVLRRELPEARLRVVGRQGRDTQDLLRELGSLAARLGVGDAVGLVVARSLDQVLGEYAAADVLLQTASDMSAPLGTAQAMAAGIPVVAVDAPGVGDLVEDGVTGRRVRPPTPRGLAAALLEVLEDPEGTAAVAMTARTRARHEFEAALVAREFRGLYAQVLSS